MVNKFSRTESRVLVYGKGHNYKVVDCNCREDVEETVNIWGKPVLYMNNFNSWQDLAAARKCYEWQMSAFPKASQNVERPTDEEEEWFWQKQLDDEHMVKDIKEIVAAYDKCLPDNPNAYALSRASLAK